MAWISHGTNNQNLIEKLKAMKAVDRSYFAPSSPYMDCPQKIGYGATISAPHMHAFALDLLIPHLTPGSKVLDVGCGSGYLLACLATIVTDKGLVVGVEHIEQLKILSENNIKRWLDSSETNSKYSSAINIHLGDGRLGFPEKAPYDAIHVGAAADPIPQNLIDQLSPNGILISPEGRMDGNQVLVKITKNPDESINREELMGVRYVPLTSVDIQLKR